jgi:hypothetical protein
LVWVFVLFWQNALDPGGEARVGSVGQEPGL